MSDGVKVTYKVDGLMKKIKRMVSLAGNLQPVLLKIRGEAMTTDTMTIIGGIGAQFVSRGAFYGTPWAELSTKPFTAWWEKPARHYSGGYASWKAEHFPGQTTLRRTDKMIRSVIVPGAEGNVEVLEPTKITWGIDDSTIPYAKYHISNGARKNLPRRAFLGITPEQRQQWRKLISGYLRETGQK